MPNGRAVAPPDGSARRTASASGGPPGVSTDSVSAISVGLISPRGGHSPRGVSGLSGASRYNILPGTSVPAASQRPPPVPPVPIPSVQREKRSSFCDPKNADQRPEPGGAAHRRGSRLDPRELPRRGGRLGDDPGQHLPRRHRRNPTFLERRV